MKQPKKTKKRKPKANNKNTHRISSTTSTLTAQRQMVIFMTIRSPLVTKPRKSCRIRIQPRSRWTRMTICKVCNILRSSTKDRSLLALLIKTIQDLMTCPRVWQKRALCSRIHKEKESSDYQMNRIKMENSISNSISLKDLMQVPIRLRTSKWELMLSTCLVFQLIANHLIKASSTSL